MEKLRNRKPVLLWSAGLDSTLLLAMLREQPYPFDIVQIRDFWTKEQLKRADKLIKEWNLKVFSYPPMQTYFIGQGDEISVVSEYAVGGGRIPLVRDVIEGTRCIADLEGQRMMTQPIDWDLFLVGSRKDDSHYSFENVIPAQNWFVGDVEFYAPLYEMSRDDVKRELKIRGLDAEEVSDELDSGNISFCSKCLHGDTFCPLEQANISGVNWSPEVNLKLFRESYA